MQRVARSASVLEASFLPLVRWRSELTLWRRRSRERAELARMSEAELHDIGITSADRWAEINKPFWHG
jgi:uncharacterized protein YjiS (DUF1127 family)